MHSVQLQTAASSCPVETIAAWPRSSASTARPQRRVGHPLLRRLSEEAPKQEHARLQLVGCHGHPQAFIQGWLNT
jgi:hypothetical protein